jgi:hypothetical protein
LRSGIRQDHKENAREFHPDTSGQSIGKLFTVGILRHFFRQIDRDCSALYAPDLLELLLKVIAHVLTAAPR